MPETQATNLDPEKLRSEIKEMKEETKKMLNDTVTNLTANFNAIIQAREAKQITDAQARERISQTSDVALDEFQSEMKDLGLDEKQGTALVNMFKKFATKQAGDFESTILNKVDGRLDERTVKQEVTLNTRKEYPDIIDKSSALFKQAQIEFKGLSKAIQNDIEGERIAVERAAKKLNIKPVDLSQAQAFEASNPTGSGPGGRTTTKNTEKEIDMAASLFNVDSKKLKNIAKDKGLL